MLTTGWLVQPDKGIYKTKVKSMVQRTGSAREHLLQILLVEEVHLFREIWPVETPRELDAKLVLVVARTLTCQLDLPSDKIIQQSHVRLDEY